MAEAIKIRAELKRDFTEVRVLMFHPMETGQRKDIATGNLIPAHYIQTITATLKGNVVFEGHISQAVSRNPIFGFRVKDAKVGDKIIITWVDNKSVKLTGETLVTAAT